MENRMAQEDQECIYSARSGPDGKCYYRNCLRKDGHLCSYEDPSRCPLSPNYVGEEETLVVS